MNSSTILLISYELALVWRSKFALNNSDWSILTFGSISVSGYDANWSEMHVKKVKALCTITFIFRFKKVPPPSLPNSNSKTNHKNIFRAFFTHWWSKKKSKPSEFSHCWDVNLNDQKTSHLYWCIPGMLGTYTIPKKKEFLKRHHCAIMCKNSNVLDPRVDHTAWISIWMTKRQAISTDAFQAC